MSVVGGLFSDVFKSQNMAVPGAANTVDWSKAGGSPADLNWNNIKPFQVIPPMSWASTNRGATAPEEAQKKLDSIATTDNLSEYQKWLASQQSQEGSRDRIAGGNEQKESWYDRTTPEERAAYFAANPTEAAISAAGMDLWGMFSPYGLAQLQEKMSPGMAAGYRQETTGISPNSLKNMIDQYSMYNNPDATSGGLFGGIPSPNETMSVADQYASYGAGREAATPDSVAPDSDGGYDGDRSEWS